MPLRYDPAIFHGGTMKTLFAALALSLSLSAHAGGAFIIPLDATKNHILYIEPIENDGFLGIAEKLKFFANAHGFETTEDKEAATFRMKADYTYTPSRIDAYVKISNTQTGDLIYKGDGYARFGALLAPGNTTWKAFQEALSGF